MELSPKMNFWGLSYDNLVAMFALDADDLSKKILNCMGCPSSFNPIAYEKGYHLVTSSDIYGSDKDTLKARAKNEVEQAIEYIIANPGRFYSATIETPEKYRAFLLDNLKKFFKTYEAEKTEARYSSEALPEIAFDDNAFDLAICPHFVFNSNPNFDTQFQIDCLQELCRVASECRIFPLLDTQGNRPEKLDEIIDHFNKSGYHTSINAVSYQLQRNADSMLVIKRKV